MITGLLACPEKGAERLPFSLSGSLLLSCLIHASLLFCIGTTGKQQFTAQVQRFQVKLSQSAVAQQNFVAKRSAFRIPVPKTEETIVQPQQPPLPPEALRDASIAGKRLFLDFELDVQPTPISELILDSQNRIPASMTGRMVLSLLISKKGEVLWTNIEYTDFDETSSRQLSDEFTGTRFLPGMVHLQAVDSIIRVEIERQ